MTTSGKELYGLIGYPVKHSFSAFMHNAAFAHCQRHARYELFEVPPEDLADFFKKDVVEKKIRGFNITVPHKERAVAYLTASISHSVKMSGAVNTVRVETDGTLSGFNTDGEGFCRDLKEQGVEVAGQKIVILGAGGGAKAVTAGLAAQGPAEIAVFDVDGQKASALAESIRRFYPRVPVSVSPSVGELGIEKASLLINATPVGMKEEDPLLVSKERIRRDLFVYDLIYNPPKTKLLKTAEAAGCRTANGLGMLLYQGCAAFEHWTGLKPPVEVMRRALLERVHA